MWLRRFVQCCQSAVSLISCRVGPGNQGEVIGDTSEYYDGGKNQDDGDGGNDDDEEGDGGNDEERHLGAQIEPGVLDSEGFPSGEWCVPGMDHCKGDHK